MFKLRCALHFAMLKWLSWSGSCCFFDIDLRATPWQPGPLNDALLNLKLSEGQHWGPNENVHMVMGEDCAIFTCAFSTNRTHFAWHFPYLRSTSQGSWLLQFRSPEQWTQYLKVKGYSWCVAATTVMKQFYSEKRRTTGSPRGRKSFKFLCVFLTQPS